jgi:DNA invertase Pin-like site-specific DNA recombinase
MKRKSNQPPALLAYYRVSTSEQGSSRLGLEAQREAVRRYAEQNRLVIAAEIEEIISTRKERPEFERALKLCEELGYTLTVARLDRLSRDLHTITTLQKSNVDFVAVDNPGASKLMIQILGAVAENERDVCSERTIAALARAKANGKQLGAPDPVANLAAAALAQAVTAEEFRAQIRPRIQQMRAQLATFQEIANTFNREGIPTPTGQGQWLPGTVHAAQQIPLRIQHVTPACAGTSAGDVQPASNDDQLPLFATASGS